MKVFWGLPLSKNKNKFLGLFLSHTTTAYHYRQRLFFFKFGVFEKKTNWMFALHEREDVFFV